MAAGGESHLNTMVLIVPPLAFLATCERMNRVGGGFRLEAEYPPLQIRQAHMHERIIQPKGLT